MVQNNKSADTNDNHFPYLQKTQIGYIQWFASLCFLVFGFIYLFVLDSKYLLISNSFFGILTYLNWFLLSRQKNISLLIHSFLAIVYLGLANVVIHIGDVKTPMIYWGLSVPLAAAFICRRQIMVYWVIIGFIFYPLTLLSKVYLFSNRINQLNDTQYILLDAASYSGILLFLGFAFFIFQGRFENNLNLLIKKQKDLENLIRVVCHDISGPISALKLRLERTSNGFKLGNLNNNILAENLGFATGIVDKITNLVDQVRSFARSMDTKYDYANSQSNLLNAFEESIRCVQHLMTKKNISLELENHCAADTFVFFNTENLIFQIFVNILSNAIKFSPAGSKIITKLYEENEMVCVSIQDEGMGIPKEILSVLGTPSSTIARNGTAGERGTGYGISIVKSYLEKFNGSIEYTTKEKTDTSNESGTIVTIKLKKSLHSQTVDDFQI